MRTRDDVPWTELWELAARQDGVISVVQLTDLGVTRPQLDWAVRCGRLERVRKGVLRAPGSPATWRQRLRAAMLSVPGSVPSHSSAAVILAMPPTGDGRLHLSIDDDRTGVIPSVVLHRSTFLPSSHITEVDGMCVTTRPRTIVDLAGTMHRARWFHLLDEEVAAHPGLLDDIEKVAERWCRRGRRGSARVREALAQRLGGPIVGPTALERRLHLVLGRPGLPELIPQFVPPWAGPGERVDGAYPDHRIVIEADSRRWHQRVADFERDRRRDQLAAAHGWVVVRVTWNQLTDEPEETVALIRDTVRARTALS